MTARRTNGGWPGLDPRRPPEDLDTAWSLLCEAFDTIRGMVAGAQGEARLANQNSVLVLGQLKTFGDKLDGVVKVVSGLNLPPMRAELDSTHSVLERKASDSFGEKLQKMASLSPGPRDQVLASPAAIRRLADDVWAEKAREAKVAADAKRLAEIDAETERSKRDLHSLKMHGLKVILGIVIVAALGIAGAYLKGRGDTASPPPAAQH